VTGRSETGGGGVSGSFVEDEEVEEDEEDEEDADADGVVVGWE
jgi:hypothetical protein